MRVGKRLISTGWKMGIRGLAEERWKRRITLFARASLGSDSKESACNAGDPGSILGSGRSHGEGNGYLTPSILVWRIPWTGSSVHGVARTRT